MKIIESLVLLIFVPVITLSGQHVEPTMINPFAREKWLENAQQEMANFQPDSCRIIIVAEITDLGPDYYACSYRLTRPGMIRLSAKEWIYIIPSSAHENPDVGDITIAMDQKNHFYINEGHVCGGIIRFQTHERMELVNSKQFFEYFYTDTDSVRWSRYK